MPNIEVSCTGVEALIGGLDDSKATGPDNISGKLLKLDPAEVSPCLTIIFKNSLRNSSVPEDWKTANITPTFKKGDRSDPRNYRPVSITSINF